MKIFLIILLFVNVSCASSRYISQTDNFSCGPVAVYNALVAEGVVPPTLAELRSAMRTMSTGTTLNDFLTVASHLDLKLIQIPATKVKINGTYIVAMAFKKDDENNIGGHFVFMRNGKAYNIFKDETESELTQFTLQGMLWQDPYGIYPMVWEVQ